MQDLNSHTISQHVADTSPFLKDHITKQFHSALLADLIVSKPYKANWVGTTMPIS
jgi:hypothetical protein